MVWFKVVVGVGCVEGVVSFVEQMRGDIQEQVGLRGCDEEVEGMAGWMNYKTLHKLTRKRKNCY